MDYLELLRDLRRHNIEIAPGNDGCVVLRKVGGLSAETRERIAAGVKEHKPRLLDLLKDRKFVD